ncbi:putative UDP-N-acetylglucosamine--dolichyl-phosphate N-acetylglucosaminephosphotransferase [Phycomyces nitens]|nr:putative UDP-N-acetylglucosamine--dolichyl-phosphate N-acetylglucosaminephosphotransferase [Phycomyces nitens]
MGIILPLLTILTLITAGTLASAHETLVVSVSLSVLAGWMTWKTLPQLKQAFVNARLCGIDVLKRDKPVIPETMGLPTAIIYLIAMFVFMPFPFMAWFGGKTGPQDTNMSGIFPHHKLGEILSAILAIQSMVLLGFADDVLDVRWRYKVWFPALAGAPLLIFYYTNCGVTDVVLPLQLRAYFGANIHLGPLYYVYMAMLIIFCTHSINILAGINGIEAGQSLVIAVSIILNDSLYLFNNPDPASLEAHLFSLYFMLPFAGVTTALLLHNWFPAKIFVGDTYCYFAGMTLAVVGILGHFSKTLLLFFMPQIFNFIYSCPQLFKIIECPRHRMPRFNPDTGLLECSTVILDSKKPTSKLGRFVVNVFHSLGLLKAFKRDPNGQVIECNNLTIINLILAYCGPMSERDTTIRFLCIQVLSSALAFFIRYKLVEYVY